MIKSIFKEIVIILLLIFAIILLLGILFYDYMPVSKIVPEKVEEYAMDENVKIELEQELNNVKSEEIVKTYMFDATDIAAYEKTKEYNKGKTNPFAVYGVSSNNTTNSNSSGSTNNNSNTSGNNNVNSGNTVDSNNNNSNTGGSFLNTTGK